MVKVKNKRKKVMKTSFSMKSYWAPTPKKARKIGDALLGVFSVTSMSSMIMENKNLAITSLVIGVVGKVLSNFFAEEPVYIQEGETEAQMD
jgi:hypothetical protein